MVEVRVGEDLWNVDSAPEGVLANWFYREGATVSAGDTLAEVMVEKSTFEIAAPIGGVLHIKVARDGVVRPGTVIAEIDGGG